MTLTLWLSLLLETALVTIPGAWRFRRVGVCSILALCGWWVGSDLVFSFRLIPGIICTLLIFRVINLLKMTKTHIHPDYLRRSTKRTSLVLVGASSILLFLMSLDFTVSASDLLLPWAAVQFVAAAALLVTTTHNLQKTKHHMTNHFYSDKELPTVTVAIPARNETNDLASCLRTILANDYPKLEVLVLDDCSQDRTAEVIKDFAHDGVRFIAGEPPSDRWLAKNQAYEVLSQHASGELILFCGVDVRFGPQAIRSLVTTMLNKKRSMMSVMPFRIGGGVNTSLLQPLRYWWELALPRKQFNRPPVLSTCWLIDRKQLKKLGGFKAVRHNIIPERYFARELIKPDAYAFIRSDEKLDIRTVKAVEEQLATAIRTRYPQLQKRPENVYMLLFVEIILLGAPFGFVLAAFWSGVQLYTVLSLLAIIFIVATNYLIMAASNPVHSVIALFHFPFALLTELVLSTVSMMQYEFGTVRWKGRNVCIPAMHVIKQLPKID